MAVHYITYTDEQTNLDNFLAKYEEQVHYSAPLAKRKNRTPKTERFCRFCQQGAPKVTFKHEPHIIPELLGRNLGVSDFECDACNQYFAKYENDFANYLGLLRTFYFVKGKENIPTFKSPKESLIARMESMKSGTKGIGITDTSGEGIYINTATGETTIKYSKNAYKPINIYKCLLKIALSVLPSWDFRFYSEMLRFITTEENHEYYVQFAKVWSYETHVRRDQPSCYLFRRRDGVNDVPKHVFMLYFENYIYEIFIPRYAPDQGLYESRKFTTFYCPPFLLEDNKATSLGASFIDFTSTDIKKNEQTSITYKLSPDYFKNAQMIDPITKEKSPFIASEIKKIRIFQIDENFDHEAFMNGDC